jgi:hypothetical protein
MASKQTIAQPPASTLPPTAPTAQIAPLNATAAQPDAATRAHRAEVRYDSGLITINASNSSLNQILREISRQTGMKITGGVKEERVFGHYGPATPDAILATLVDGTETNMVLRQTADNKPEELILTPRAGGASPPNPNAPSFDDSTSDDGDRPEPLQRGAYAGRPQVMEDTDPRPPSVPLPANNVNGSPLNTSPTASTLPVTNSVPTDSIPTPSTTPSTTGIVDAPNPPDPGTVNPAAPSTDPNAVKTPEDYARELQQLRQQQQEKSKTVPQ